METFFLHLLPYIANHLESIQFHIEFHLRHFYLLNGLRFLHVLPFFDYMSDEVMAFSIIPMLLIPIENEIIIISFHIPLIVSMKLLLLMNLIVSLQYRLWSLSVVERGDLYEGWLLFYQIIKLIIIRFSIGVFLFITTLCWLPLHLQRTVALANSVYALGREFPVW